MSYVFYVTVPTLEEGEKIASILVEEKIVACVNILKNIFSVYRWKGRIEKDTEHLLLIKTNAKNSEKLINKIEEIHSYETPECIGFKIDKGSKDYLKWLNRVVE